MSNKLYQDFLRITGQLDKEILFVSQRKGKRIYHFPYSYNQLEKKADRVAGFIEKMGVKKGDRVLIFIPMSLELYIALIGLMKRGVVSVIIDPSMGIKQMEAACSLVKPKLRICIRKALWLAVISKVFRSIPCKMVVNSSWTDSSVSWGKIVNENADFDFNINELAEDDPILLTFTSGSTGIPKGMPRSYGFLSIQSKIVSKYFETNPQDIELTALPVFILNNMASHLMSVIPLSIDPVRGKWDFPGIVKQLTDLGVNRSTGSPGFFYKLSCYCIKHKQSFSLVKAIYTGGAPVGLKFIRLIKKVFPNATLHIFYGSTEAEPISHITGNEIHDKCKELIEQGTGYCVGRPVAEIRVEIIRVIDTPLDFTQARKEDIILSVGKIGEIIVAGNHVNTSYYENQDEETRSKIKDHNGTIWHRTFDTGYKDDKGCLWLVGRTNQRVIKGGKVIYPYQVESLVDSFKWIERSAFVGVEDKKIWSANRFIYSYPQQEPPKAQKTKRRNPLLMFEKRHYN